MSPDNQQVSEILKSRFGEKIISAEVLYDMLCVIVSHDVIYEVLKFLKEDSTTHCSFLTTCCGLHYPDAKAMPDGRQEKFGMMYQLHNLEKNYRIRIKTFTGSEDPEFPSMIPLWSAANWMEREAYDFYGFRFKGHPDLRRILNMDSLEGWPMRKEYPLEDQDRGDKDDKMFGR